MSGIGDICIYLFLNFFFFLLYLFIFHEYESYFIIYTSIISLFYKLTETKLFNIQLEKIRLFSINAY